MKHRVRQMREEYDSVDKPSHNYPIIEFIWHTAWAIVFWIKYGDIAKATCEGPTFFWTNFSRIYNLVGAIFILCWMILSAVGIRSKYPDSYFEYWLSVIMAWIFLIIRIVGFVCAIAYIVCFIKIGDCEDMRKVILAQFILTIIFFAILLLICSLSGMIFICCPGSSFSEKYARTISYLLKSLLPLPVYEEEAYRNDNDYRQPTTMTKSSRRPQKQEVELRKLENLL